MSFLIWKLPNLLILRIFKVYVVSSTLYNENYTQYPLIRNDVKSRLVRFLIFPKFYTDFVSYFSHVIQSSFLRFYLILYSPFLNFRNFFKIYDWFARKKFDVWNQTLKRKNIKDKMGKWYLDPLSAMVLVSTCIMKSDIFLQ